MAGLSDYLEKIYYSKSQSEVGEILSKVFPDISPEELETYSKELLEDHKKKSFIDLLLEGFDVDDPIKKEITTMKLVLQEYGNVLAREEEEQMTEHKGGVAHAVERQ